MIAHCEGCFNCIDDFLVFGETEEEHDATLNKLMKTLESNNVQINVNKCTFRAIEVEFLEHILTRTGIKPSPNKVEAIKSFRKPENATELRSFLGLINYRELVNELMSDRRVWDPGDSSTDESKRKRQDYTETSPFSKSKKTRRTPVKQSTESGEMEEIREFMKTINENLKEIRKENQEFKEELITLRQESNLLKDEVSKLRSRVEQLEFTEEKFEHEDRMKRKNNVTKTHTVEYSPRRRNIGEKRPRAKPSNESKDPKEIRPEGKNRAGDEMPRNDSKTPPKTLKKPRKDKLPAMIYSEVAFNRMAVMHKHHSDTKLVKGLPDLVMHELGEILDEESASSRPLWMISANEATSSGF
nr:unnamed protein product [Callosobruchus chinensis]